MSERNEQPDVVVTEPVPSRTAQAHVAVQAKVLGGFWGS